MVERSGCIQRADREIMCEGAQKFSKRIKSKKPQAKWNEFALMRLKLLLLRTLSLISSSSVPCYICSDCNTLSGKCWRLQILVESRMPSLFSRECRMPMLFGTMIRQDRSDQYLVRRFECATAIIRVAASLTR
jgi:hypothetical protein